MSEIFSRTELILGEQNIKKLNNSHIAIFGVGGVGGYVLEGLVRAGVERFDLIDNDTVSVSNINRQIIATNESIGQNKVEVAKKRAMTINSNVMINTFTTFFLPENKNEFDFSKYDYVIDAIDTVSGKIAIIEKANESNTPVISSMGTGNKVNPTMFEVDDIYNTSVCPLAKVMRKELKKRNINSLKVVYSKEAPITPKIGIQEHNSRIPGSISFCPSVAGLIIASEVVKDITGFKNDVKVV